MQIEHVIFDAELIRRYDKSGPRYTSYPTAIQFTEDFGPSEYRDCAAASDQQAPLSLYFHIPFCDTVCFYCGCNKVVTKHREWAAPYLQRVHQELALQAELFDQQRPVVQLHWGGGTPTFISHDEMRELMEITRQHFNLLDNDEGEYSIEVDPREVKPDTLALLRELGFNRISLGVQDFDPQVQKAVNRIQPEEQTLAVLNESRRLGFSSINLDLIYGLPFQSVSTFERTLDKVIAANPDRLSVFNYAHLPELFKPQRRINSEDLPSPEAKLDILQLVIERLIEAGYVYIGMDHFAKPDDELARAQRDGTLYRNFQGYSTHADCDLVAAGITSIGRVGDCYAQNVKTLDDYYQRIDGGELAIYRGIQLDADDLLRRYVITELICHFQLDFDKVAVRFGIEFDDYFASELKAMATLADDGLVVLSPAHLQVTPRGQLLIRNVCMVFDRYLGKDQGARYSKVI